MHVYNSFVTYHSQNTPGQYVYDDTYAEQFNHNKAMAFYGAKHITHHANHEGGFHAGTSITLEGYETHYPIIVNGEGGLGNPANSQETIKTAFVCDAKLYGTTDTNPLDAESYEGSFGTN